MTHSYQVMGRFLIGNNGITFDVKCHQNVITSTVHHNIQYTA